ncbi:hypothetical protein ACFQL4_01415 [Halosimplex aquaticum]
MTTDTLLVRVATDGAAVRGARATVAPQYGDPDRFATATVYDATSAFDSPGDLVVGNRDCAERAFDLDVTYDGDLFLRESIALSPAESRRFAGVFALPGEWRVSVRADGESVAEALSLSSDPPETCSPARPATGRSRSPIDPVASTTRPPRAVRRTATPTSRRTRTRTCPTRSICGSSTAPRAPTG